MLHYSCYVIDISEGTGINKTSASKNMLLSTISMKQIKDLSLNHLQMVVMMY